MHHLDLCLSRQLLDLHSVALFESGSSSPASFPRISKVSPSARILLYLQAGKSVRLFLVCFINLIGTIPGLTIRYLNITDQVSFPRINFRRDCIMMLEWICDMINP